MRHLLFLTFAMKCSKMAEVIEGKCCLWKSFYFEEHCAALLLVLLFGALVIISHDDDPAWHDTDPAQDTSRRNTATQTPARHDAAGAVVWCDAPPPSKIYQWCGRAASQFLRCFSSAKIRCFSSWCCFVRFDTLNLHDTLLLLLSLSLCVFKDTSPLSFPLIFSL